MDTGIRGPMASPKLVVLLAPRSLVAIATLQVGPLSNLNTLLPWLNGRHKRAPHRRAGRGLARDVKDNSQRGDCRPAATAHLPPEGVAGLAATTYPRRGEWCCRAMRRQAGRAPLGPEQSLQRKTAKLLCVHHLVNPREG